MNPINDGIPAKDSTNVEESGENLKEAKLDEGLKENEKNTSESLQGTTIDIPSNEEKENKEGDTHSNEEKDTHSHEEKEKKEEGTHSNKEKEKSKDDEISENLDQTENTKTDKISNAEANKESSPADPKPENVVVKEKPEEEEYEKGPRTETVNDNENSSQSEVNEKDKDKESEENVKEIVEGSESELNNKIETDLEAQDFEDLNKGTCIVSEPATEDETEEFENVEDVEIPDEEDVDEIIVPDDEAEAEDLTDEKDQNVETENSQSGEAEDEEELSGKESDGEDNESDINLHEQEEEATTKSSEAAEKDEEEEIEDDGDGESDKRSVNIDEKDDAVSSKDYDEAAELVVLEEITNSESCKEQAKSDQTDLDEDTTTQASYDPLNCPDNKEADDDENVSIKNTETENSNESHQTQEKDENEEEDGKSTKNIESGNENSDESQSQQREDNEENEEDDEVQFVETRNSPICIESDDDDAVPAVAVAATANTKDTNATTSLNSANRTDTNRRIITTATTTVTVPKNITVTRTSARKSTARPPQIQMSRANNSAATAVAAAAAIVPQTQNRMKSFNYLQKATTFKNRPFIGTSTQKIVDCIELLDSSDEESSSNSTRPQQQRTPQKRTLLAAKGNFYKNSNNSKTTNPAVNRLPHNFTPQIRQQPKKPAPPPLPPPTPQSNFLNAVQLQPAAITGANPPAFSALLSNKNVIIPNAFYGNPPSIRGNSSSDLEAEKRSVRWLENFLNQFCKPQFEPTHSCFVFLQRALKYKDFVRIKALRTSMNNHVQNASNQLNIELMTDLKTIFFKNVKKITNYGQRFCELTCTTTAGKAVTLITHRLSGKVTLKTCNMELPKLINSSNSAANASASSQTSSTNTTSTRKRQLNEDEDEYTPDRSVYKAKGKLPSENGDEDSGDTGDDRKRSLRTKRTKRIDNSFSYNEDDLLAEYEINDEDDEKLALVEIQRKIEQKRLEAQKQRQQQAKSFESAFIQAFARSADGPTTSTKTKNNATNQRIRLRNSTTATVSNIKQYTANNDAEDLLQATWIENYENDNTQIISDDDEPQEHRIYKQQQEELQKQREYYKLPRNLTISKVVTTNPSSKPTGRATKRTANRNNQEEFITGDNDHVENNNYANNSLNGEPLLWPKNVDPQMTVAGKNKDRCIICSLNCQRLVHHYVNEHRGCETYNSRLSATQIKKLKQGNSTASVSLYKNGQNLYEAFCIFCNKISRFMLRYWYQHYTMHTGEYAYRCTGCGVRKPTQSLLTLHHSQGCTEVGGGIIQDYVYDAKSLQIEAKICSLCNYVQLHRSNIVKHLHTQHFIKQILPKHILTVVLMKIPPHLAAGTSSTAAANTPAHSNRRSFNTRSSAAAYSSASAASSNTFVIEEDDDNDMNYEEILPDESSSQPPQPPENHYYNYIPPYMQAAFESGNLTFENVEAGDDLSFMICGMLDVQMNTNDAD